MWNEKVQGQPDTLKSIVPLIKVTPTETEDGNFLELAFKKAADFGNNSTGFTPINNNAKYAKIYQKFFE